MRRLHGDRGDATVEAVLCVPVLLVVFMTVIQFGLWYHAEHVVHAAAQEGVRAARVDTGSAENGRTRSEQFMTQAAPALVHEVTVTVTRTADHAEVHVHGFVHAVVPGLDLTVDARESSPLERFEADR